MSKPKDVNPLLAKTATGYTMMGKSQVASFALFGKQATTC